MKRCHENAYPTLKLPTYFSGGINTTSRPPNAGGGEAPPGLSPKWTPHYLQQIYVPDIGNGWQWQPYGRRLGLGHGYWHRHGQPIGWSSHASRLICSAKNHWGALRPIIYDTVWSPQNITVSLSPRSDISSFNTFSATVNLLYIAPTASRTSV